MEFVDGVNLKKNVQTNDDFATITAVVANCVIALKHVHSRGVIHCHLKSDNIMILPKSEAKLIDFGVSF